MCCVLGGLIGAFAIPPSVREMFGSWGVWLCSQWEGCHYWSPSIHWGTHCVNLSSQSHLLLRALYASVFCLCLSAFTNWLCFCLSDGTTFPLISLYLQIWMRRKQLLTYINKDCEMWEQWDWGAAHMAYVWGLLCTLFPLLCLSLSEFSLVFHWVLFRLFGNGNLLKCIWLHYADTHFAAVKQGKEWFLRNALLADNCSLSWEDLSSLLFHGLCSDKYLRNIWVSHQFIVCSVQQTAGFLQLWWMQHGWGQIWVIVPMLHTSTMTAFTVSSAFTVSVAQKQSSDEPYMSHSHYLACLLCKSEGSIRGHCPSD